MVPIKEMTYIFISISIAILNALADTNILLFYSVLSQIAVIGLILKFERSWSNSEIQQKVLYEKIELIKPEKRKEMLEDLSTRTGYNVHKVEIESIDFMRDVAEINIYYYDKN